MRKLLIVPALVLAVATAAGLAVASSDDVRIGAPRDQWLTIGQIAEKFASKGYDVREIEVEKDGYEVTAIDSDGRRLETHVHPVTGEPLAVEIDD